MTNVQSKKPNGYWDILRPIGSLVLANNLAIISGSELVVMPTFTFSHFLFAAGVYFHFRIGWKIPDEHPAAHRSLCTSGLTCKLNGSVELGAWQRGNYIENARCNLYFTNWDTTSPDGFLCCGKDIETFSFLDILNQNTFFSNTSSKLFSRVTKSKLSKRQM